MDLRWTRAPLEWQGCEVRDVVFDGTELGPTWPGIGVIQSDFTDCSFRSADLGHACLDLQMAKHVRSQRVRSPRNPPSTYRRCDFTRTRFRRYASLGFAVFEDCLFDSTKLPGYDALDGPSLYRCTFTGKFGSHYLGFSHPPKHGEDLPRIVNCDFSSAHFEDLTHRHFESTPGPSPRVRPEVSLLRWLLQK